MPFYLDEDQSHRIAPIARAAGADVISTWECHRNSRPDDEQLAFAAEQGRAIVTRNYPDFDWLTKQFQAEGRPHAGVLFVSPSLAPTDFAGIAAAIVQYDREHPDGMPPYMIDYLRPVPR